MGVETPKGIKIWESLRQGSVSLRAARALILATPLRIPDGLELYVLERDCKGMLVFIEMARREGRLQEHDVRNLYELLAGGPRDPVDFRVMLKLRDPSVMIERVKARAGVEADVDELYLKAVMSTTQAMLEPICHVVDAQQDPEKVRADMGLGIQGYVDAHPWKKMIVVSVNGPIGSGKTTQGDSLVAAGAYGVREPMKRWGPILEYFYADRAGRTLSLQLPAVNFAKGFLGLLCGDELLKA